MNVEEQAFGVRAAELYRLKAWYSMPQRFHLDAVRNRSVLLHLEGRFSFESKQLSDAITNLPQSIREQPNQVANIRAQQQTLHGYWDGAYFLVEILDNYKDLLSVHIGRQNYQFQYEGFQLIVKGTPNKVIDQAAISVLTGIPTLLKDPTVKPFWTRFLHDDDVHKLISHYFKVGHTELAQALTVSTLHLSGLLSDGR